MFRDSPRVACCGEPVSSRTHRLRRLLPARTFDLGVALAVMTALSAGCTVRPARAERWVQQRDTSTTVDLRCLTRRAEDCLPEPVPADEPHGAVCAVCHELWSGEVPARSARSCVDVGCHTAPQTLSAFHRTIGEDVLRDCGTCHKAHTFRVAGEGRDCRVCHASGGAPMPGTTLRARTVVAEGLTFTHGDHQAVTCTSCHGAAWAHGTVSVRTRAACRACHHTEPHAEPCVACHVVDEVRATSFDVTRTLNISIGSLDHPARTIHFDHANHWHTDCAVCHTGGPDLGTARGADCSGCHLEHHEATANCNGCHERPREGAHTREAHLGCGGAGCHDPVPEGIRLAPRTRSLCLACHTQRMDHKPGQSCVDCHQLPDVGG
jgi:hypothetical protein